MSLSNIMFSWMGIDFVLGLSSLEAVIIKTLQGLCNRWKTEYVTWGMWHQTGHKSPIRLSTTHTKKGSATSLTSSAGNAKKYAKNAYHNGLAWHSFKVHLNILCALLRVKRLLPCYRMTEECRRLTSMCCFSHFSMQECMFFLLILLNFFRFKISQCNKQGEHFLNF